MSREMKGHTLRETENPEDYFIAEKNIDDTECERDLKVFVSSDGTYHEHVNSATLKAKRVVGLM